MSRQADWTDGPARFAAALVLGAAAIGGMVWSVTSRARAPVPSQAFHDPGVGSRRTSETAPRSHAPRTNAPAGRSESEPASDTRESQASDRPAVAGGLIDVNRASATELELLPGIGPTLSQRIVDYREANGPFRTIEALDDVKGIGSKTLEKLRPMVTVGDAGG